MSVLLIGLGGTGGEVLKLVKRKMSDSPFKNDIAFYYIDSRARSGAGFGPGEFKHIGGFRISEIVQSHKDNIQNWWFPIKPPDIKTYSPDFDTTDGAGQTRLIGRLCFYLYADEIKTEIDNILSTSLPGIFLDVIVVCSGAGGTGSGIFYDMGYFLKTIIGNRRRAKYMGVMLDPSVVRDRLSPDNSAKAKSVINGLGFLTELEFFMDKQNNYRFEYLSQGKLTAIEGKNWLPYDAISILQIENTSGHSFADKDDFYELPAEGIWHLINISFREHGGQQGGTGLENYFHQLWQAIPINGKTQHYASFGCATIEFPFSKVFTYCKNLYSDKLIDILLSELTVQDHEEINKTVNDLILSEKIKESDNCDHLIKRAREILYENNNQWKSNPAKLTQDISNKLMAVERFQAILDNLETNLKKDLKVLKDKTLKSSLNENILKVANKYKKEIDDLFKAGKWRKAAALTKKLLNILETEIIDITKNEEEGWLQKRNIDNIQADLNKTANEIINLMNVSSIKKFFKKKSIEEDIKVKKRNLARKWIDELFTYYFLDSILSLLKDFYRELINLLKNYEQKIVEAINNFEEYRKQIRIQGILNTRADIPGNKQGIDFYVEICASQDVVDSKIFVKNDQTSQQTDLRNIAENPTIETFEEIAKGTIERVLAPISLDEALKLETEYFWVDRSNNIKNTFEKGTHSDKVKLVNDLKDVFSLDSLNEIHERIESYLTGKGQKVKDEEALRILVRGRISLLLDWAKPFWQWKSGQVNIAEPFSYSVYHTNPRNNIVKSILTRLNPEIANRTKTTGYDIKDPYKLIFFQLQGIQPLFNLTQISALRDTEGKRRSLFQTLVEAQKISNPDQIGYNDRQFIYDKPYCVFSIFPSEKEENAFVLFGLSEAFGYIVSGSQKSRRDFKLTIDLGVKSGRRGQGLGSSLSDSLRYIESHDEVLAALEETCNKEFSEQKIKDQASLAQTIRKQLDLYQTLKKKYGGQKGKASNEISELYKNLYDKLADYAVQNGIDIKK